MAELFSVFKQVSNYHGQLRQDGEHLAFLATFQISFRNIFCCNSYKIERENPDDILCYLFALHA